MDLNQFLLALRARRKAFTLVMIATIVTAIAVALILPKRYVGTTSVLVDARDEQSMTATRLSPRERAGYMATQVDLIQSGRVAAKVARDLKLAQAPGVRDEWQAATGGVGSIDDWIGAGLLEKLKVETSAGNIINITYASSEARKAADVANAFAKAYMETAVQLRTEPSNEAAQWFDEQLKGLRAQVAQAQTKLVSYQKEKGIISTDERGDVETTRIAEINTQLLAARNATYEARTRHKLAADLVAGGGAPDALPEVMASPAILAIKSDLTRAEARLENATADLGPKHPAYLRAASEVDGLKAKLNSEMKKVVTALGNAAQAAQRREDELKQALADQHKRLDAMKEYRIELAHLSRDAESAARAYDTALTRYMTNKIESRARATNVALLTPAIEPVKPAFPKVGLVSGLAIVVGALLAAAVVYVLEMLDRRVRSRADLESRLAVPSLGRLSKWQQTGGRLLPATISNNTRAARALPHPW
ncbi:MAG TPA: chain length determinant protein EpsF [Burkholderiales bacterium]|nr:chain length determinant protein EpsF [Burkholderiales bacterium]